MVLVPLPALLKSFAPMANEPLHVSTPNANKHSQVIFLPRASKNASAWTVQGKLLIWGKRSNAIRLTQAFERDGS